MKAGTANDTECKVQIKITQNVLQLRSVRQRALWQQQLLAAQTLVRVRSATVAVDRRGARGVVCGGTHDLVSLERIPVCVCGWKCETQLAFATGTQFFIRIGVTVALVGRINGSCN